MRWSRRRFLVGGAGLVAIPLLPSLSRAAPDTPPLRFVCIYSGNGYRPEQFLPTGSETSFTMGGMLTPLARHQAKLIVAHGAGGIDGHYAGHGAALTGRPDAGDSFAPTGGPSLDQVLAADGKGQVPLLSLELGVDPWTSVDGVIAFSDTALPIPPLADPRGAFDRVYNVASVDPKVAARRRAQKLSVLDSVTSDIASLQARLSAGERRLLDAHLTLLREEEDALLNPVDIGECDVGAGPSGSEFTFDETLGHHLDTIAAAFRCDVTRVATLVLKGAQDTTYYDWLPGVVDDAHSVAHGSVSNAESQLLAINSWQAEQVATLLDRLDAIPEGNGTVLDNTLVFWTNEIGLQDWSHSRSEMGLIVAGATSRLRSGRFVDLGAFGYADLLLTLAHAMGHTELTSFGDDGTSVIEGLLR
jgi:hypothetical protein